jgi:hypothetical protein
VNLKTPEIIDTRQEARLMKSSAMVLFAAALGVGMMGGAREARALGPVDLEVGARVGVGGAPFSNEPNPLGFGLGGRAGAVFSGWYGGLSLMYYVGGRGPVNYPAGSVSVSEHALLYGLEAGYGVKFLGLLTVRGQLGVGSFNAHWQGQGEGDVGNLYLEPGVTALVTFGLLFVGADVSLLVLPGIGDPAYPLAASTWAVAPTAHAQVGVTF